MHRFLLLSTLIWLLSGIAAMGQEVAEDVKTSLETASATRLCEEFLRVAHMAAMSEPLDTSAIIAAVTLINEAAKLTPSDESVWYAMIEIAQMADLPDMRRRGIRELLRVTPTQTSSQLGRLRDVVERTNTVDQRMDVYEQLLSKDSDITLDPRVASRLALDAAMLQRQLGDINQFARWLAESVALDPSYPRAMSLAAGFFGDESADVYRRAELLASAFLSNIGDMTTQVALAEYLMAFGDYEDARVLYEAAMGDDAGDASIISDGLLADIVLSQWAAGDIVAAQDTLLTRQIAVDEKFRNQTRQQQPRITPLELARIHAPLVPKLATVRAAIYASQDDASQAGFALDAAVGSILTLSKLYEFQNAETISHVIELYLQAAWITLWLDGNVESAISIIERAETGAILGVSEKQRLNGWIALRQGDPTQAIALLSDLTDDPAARAGMALAYLETNNTQAAAKEFLHIARQWGGTVLGVWSANQLQHLVGQRFDLRPEVEDLKILMANVLQTMHTFVQDPRPPIALSVQPTKVRFDPYEPILVDIEILNNTTIPLTIAKGGPIQPFMLLEGVINIARTSIEAVPPMIIPIDRELSLYPRESIAIQTDLRQHWIGGILNTFPLRGASITIRATVNFTARETQTRMGQKVLVYDVGRLGINTDSDSFRIEGVRVTDTWLKTAIEQAKKATTIEDITSLVLLTWVVGEDITIQIDEPLITPPEDEVADISDEEISLALQNEAIIAVLTSFPSLDAISQAWMISTMSDEPSVEAVVSMTKDPQSVPTQLAWIIRFASITVPDEALDDPRLLLALESNNDAIRDVSSWVYAWVEKITAVRAEQQLGPQRP